MFLHCTSELSFSSGNISTLNPSLLCAHSLRHYFLPSAARSRDTTLPSRGAAPNFHILEKVTATAIINREGWSTDDKMSHYALAPGCLDQEGAWTPMCFLHLHNQAEDGHVIGFPGLHLAMHWSDTDMQGLAVPWKLPFYSIAGLAISKDWWWEEKRLLSQCPTACIKQMQGVQGNVGPASPYAMFPEYSVSSFPAPTWCAPHSSHPPLSSALWPGPSKVFRYLNQWELGT